VVSLGSGVVSSLTQGPECVLTRRIRVAPPNAVGHYTVPAPCPGGYRVEAPRRGEEVRRPRAPPADRRRAGLRIPGGVSRGASQSGGQRHEGGPGRPPERRCASTVELTRTVEELVDHTTNEQGVVARGNCQPPVCVPGLQPGPAAELLADASRVPSVEVGNGVGRPRPARSLELRTREYLSRRCAWLERSNANFGAVVRAARNFVSGQDAGVEEDTPWLVKVVEDVWNDVSRELSCGRMRTRGLVRRLREADVYIGGGLPAWPWWCYLLCTILAYAGPLFLLGGVVWLWRRYSVSVYGVSWGVYPN